MGSKFFLKVENLDEIFEIFENFGKRQKIGRGGAPALRVIRAGTRLTVHRSLP